MPRKRRGSEAEPNPLWCYSGPMLMIRIHVRRQSFPTLQPIVTLKICNGLVCMAQFMQGAFSAQYHLYVPVP
jgi:hypothetical protein